MKQCPNCGQYTDDFSRFCGSCGHNFSQTNGQPTPPPYNAGGSYTDNAFDACGPEGKSRGIAALLAIFLGGLGIHYFYLGKTNAGIISIILTVVTCGLWQTVMFIQGIVMLCMTNAQFREKFVDTDKAFPLF